jgi:hypothetical protein
MLFKEIIVVYYENHTKPINVKMQISIWYLLTLCFEGLRSLQQLHRICEHMYYTDAFFAALRT